MPQADTSSMVFISYSRDDTTLIQRLRTDLQAKGISTWIDKSGIEPGSPDWEDVLRKAIRSSIAVLLIASPSSRVSRFVRDELRIAQMYQRPIYPIWILGSEWIDCVPMGWGDMQHIDARDAHYSAALDEIAATLKNLSQTEIPASLRSGLNFDPRNPYKGLQAFTNIDTRDFFGRAALLDGLVEAIGESITQQNGKYSRLLAVVGPSGSGKSSLVMAGLLPRLRQGVLPGSAEWIYLKPIQRISGTSLVEELAIRIQEYLPEKKLQVIQEDLADSNARGLYSLASQLVSKPELKVVIVIDQFEELFAQDVSSEERQHFIDLLVTAAVDPLSPVVLVLAMRADFSDRPMQYLELAKLFETHRRVVPPTMELQDLRMAIEQPAALPEVQLVFEDNLVGDLLFEMRGQAGALPLLQFTLDRLYQLRSGHLLTRQAYQEIGGVIGALTKYAEEIYEHLPTEEYRQMARALCLRLIDPNIIEDKVVRRRAFMSEFSLPSENQTKIISAVIDTFVEARLLVANNVGGTKTVEVAHEILIQNWDRFTKWVHEAQKELPQRQRIYADSAYWKQQRIGLYRGQELANARIFMKQNMLSKDEVEFLQASIRSQRSERLKSAVGIGVGIIGILGAAIIGLAESVNKDEALTERDHMRDERDRYKKKYKRAKRRNEW